MGQRSSDTPIGDRPPLPEERREPPGPAPVPEGEPPPAHHPEDHHPTSSHPSAIHRLLRRPSVIRLAVGRSAVCQCEEVLR